MTFIEFNHVKKSYDGINLVVKDFNIKIEKGEFVTMLGPSGSGKTTCLMMLAGFETVTDGEIILNGKHIEKLAPHKRDIGTVFQNYALFPHMTVEENLAYPLKIRKKSKDEISQKVSEYLSLVELEDFKKRYPAALSGGQRQRVALARALIFEPQLILMDEPLSALDKHLRETMQYEIKEIHRKLNVTVVYVTHDQSEALTMSDRIAVFNDGVVQQLDTPTNLYRYPKNSFVANFIGENNVLDGTLKSKNNDFCEVELSNNKVIKAKPVNIGEVGSKVSVCIRPERIFINDMAEKCDDIIDAVVEDVTFIGEYSRVQVKAANEKLVIKIQNTSQTYQPKLGEKIKVGWFHEYSPALDYLSKQEREKLKE